MIYAPIQGNVIPRENIPDETFASGVLGDGVGIEPETGEVVAPFDGKISSVTETCHAIGITGPGGMELLIHVGVDTVKMNGDGFTVLVSEGDKVKAGSIIFFINPPEKYPSAVSYVIPAYHSTVTIFSICFDLPVFTTLQD